jgi:hypothetical protein
VWPLVVLGLAKAARHRAGLSVARLVLVASVGLAMASGVWGLVLYHIAGQNRVYYGTDTRAVAILVGAALAALIALRGPAVTHRGRIGVEAAGIAGVAVLAVAWLRLPGTSPVLYEGGLITCSLAAVAVIAAATHPSKGPVAQALALRPLMLLGIISYGVYLYHWPIFLWLQRVTDLQGWSLFALQVAVTLAVSVVSYKVVESPIRRGVLRWPRSLVVVPTTAVVIVVSMIAVTAGYVPVSATVSRADSLRAVTGAVKTKSPTQARLLLVGNSVPFYLAREGFESLKTEEPLLVLNGAFPECAFPPSATAYRLSQSDVDLPLPLPCNQGWTSDVQSFHPDVVLFTMGDLLGEVRDGTNGQWYRPCGAGFDAWFKSSLLDAYNVFTRDGAHFVIATSAYSQYFQAPANRWTQTDCMNRIEHEVGSLHPKNVSVIDLGHFVCPTFGVCRQTIDGAPMRPDGVHYRDKSAVAIATWILPQLRFGPTDRPLDTLVSQRVAPVGHT